MKKLLAMLLALTLLFVFVACGNEPATQTKPTETKPAGTEPTGTEPTEGTEVYGEGNNTFTVIVVHKDGTEKKFTYKTNDPYVGKILQESGLIKGNDGPYGLEIIEVDGEKAVYTEDKAYWAVYEGEEYALQGIDTTPVVNGGVYKLVYTGA